MVDTYELFNMKFVEFLEDLIATYPEETDLQVMLDMLRLTIRVAGYKIPQEMFNICVANPFTEQISTCNESFFLEECSYDSEYADINIINKLKSKWRMLKEDDKIVVWKYLHVLLALNKKCI